MGSGGPMAAVGSELFTDVNPLFVPMSQAVNGCDAYPFSVQLDGASVDRLVGISSLHYRRSSRPICRGSPMVCAEHGQTIAIVDAGCMMLDLLVHDPDCLRFLDADDRERLVKNDAGPIPFKTELKGYPCSPLYAHIANYLALIAMSGTCPVFNQPKFQTLHEWNNATYR
ncbi:unnamed protein product [Dibothriocephalus latus]|uniref:Uncharacterized protein n=1 Tax=Dibothriocephalus latus TaxID=60516 RepID=A0A3P7QU90_DIBLA|nr:unnamed protein product [Dibothriocephalus latus]